MATLRFGRDHFEDWRGGSRDLRNPSWDITDHFQAASDYPQRQRDCFQDLLAHYQDRSGYF
jgi:hypothetical protein